MVPRTEEERKAKAQALFNAARVYALAVEFAAQDVSRQGERAIALYRNYRSRALDLLDEALKYAPDQDDRDAILNDPALRSIRRGSSRSPGMRFGSVGIRNRSHAFDFVSAAPIPYRPTIESRRNPYRTIYDDHSSPPYEIRHPRASPAPSRSSTKLISRCIQRDALPAPPPPGGDGGPNAAVGYLRDEHAGDSGPGSLRQAIHDANAQRGAETITFDPTAFATPQTITLTSGQLELSDPTGTETITGPAAGVTVSGGGTSRVFQVDAGVTASISGLTITGGSMPATAAACTTTATIHADRLHRQRQLRRRHGGGLYELRHDADG